MSILRNLVLVFTFIQMQNVFADDEMYQKGISQVLDDAESYYDKNFDYSNFPGRITDRSDDQKVFKIKTENKNIKLFRAGDLVEFKIDFGKTDEGEYCQGHVRTVEKEYLVLYVEDFNVCWKTDETLRIGSMLRIKSERLKDRVQESSTFRISLIKRKTDYFGQLKAVNNFIWNYDQEKVKIAEIYDQQILELQKKKEDEIGRLVEKKKEQVKIQAELMARLDIIEKDLNFYRIERSEILNDRWFQDHDLGLPVTNRPQAMKKLDKEISTR